jgi:hypothetical protein
MGFSMTAPMVGWMRFRGHTWPANRAMATSMIAPTLAAIALLAAGAATDLHGALMIQHVAMFPAMSSRCSCTAASTPATTRRAEDQARATGRRGSRRLSPRRAG